MRHPQESRLVSRPSNVRRENAASQVTWAHWQAFFPASYHAAPGAEDPETPKPPARQGSLSASRGHSGEIAGWWNLLARRANLPRAARFATDSGRQMCDSVTVDGDGRTKTALGVSTPPALGAREGYSVARVDTSPEA